ncbi:hypothetical protein OESDEN_17954 [Oesophagostomum dentatum]|uniref:Nematode fatty acid retinoid binding protein n=1 Tax=Oesophagostomum dentatum TaxID=61180 RepID=A0A0B1SFM5_OESDE|nr:hypothetical protein OESDEN_17954 [Oesophagostomum dentatum]
MKPLLLVISLTGLGFAAEFCQEDQAVVKNVEDVIGQLKDAFKSYADLMASKEKECSKKLGIAAQGPKTIQYLYEPLYAQFNSIYDQYESPLRSNEEICNENESVMEEAKEVIERLPEAFKKHKAIMDSDKSCKEKRDEIFQLSAEDPAVKRKASF